MRDEGSEPTSNFRTSSFCSTGGCVGVAATPDGVEITDVADVSAARLRFDRTAWTEFVAGVKAGEFDLPR